MSKRIFTPKPYQKQGTQFLLDTDRALLLASMGTGKTMMVLNAIDILNICGINDKVLILAPLRVARSTWKNEVAKWEHLSRLKVATIVGDPGQRKAALNSQANIYTCNYENIPWLIEQCGNAWPFKTIVCDESTKLKSHRSHFKKKKDGTRYLVCTGGVRTAALARVAFKKTERMWLLTGTPAPNGLIDLWGQQFFLDFGKALGSSYSAFTDRWYKLDYNGYDLKMLDHAEKEIRDAIAPTTFTLRAEDYLNLGEEIFNTIYVDLPEKARKHYREMERDLYTVINAGEVEAFTAATKSMKCHQLANGALYHDDKGSWEPIHNEKLEALQEVLEESGGLPVLVCYKFKSDLARLQKAFPNGISLDTVLKNKDNSSLGNVPIFIHPDSAGHGVDGLQNVTNIMCFYSIDWNAETRLQVIARIGNVRQFQAGLDRPVFIHQIVARNTVDEDILRRIESKMTVQDALKEGLARRNLK